ncbi:MAG: hypothetical protein JWM93_2323 [Frankiales bacterium]|nr:hypothetical protein [Frankiales bacterium]
MFRRTKSHPRAPITARSLLRPDACAGCLAERAAADALLTSLVTDAVTDPDARDDLRASHGWCSAHLERAVRIASADGGRSSVAILYADVLRHLDANGLARPSAHPVCGVCAHVVEVLPYALRDLIIAVERGDVADALAGSAPLCLTHTAAVAGMPKAAGRDALLASGLRELRAVAVALQDFADRQDHRSTDRADRGSIERLLAFVRGAEPATGANQARPRR